MRCRSSLIATILLACLAVLCSGCGETRAPASPAEAALINDLREAGPETRLAAARELGRIGSAAAVPGLTRSMYDPRSDVRLAAAEALGSIGHASAIEPLARALKARDWRMRRTAAESLGKISNPHVIEPLAAALADAEESVTTVAAVNLGRIGAPAVRAVAKLLDHASPRARTAAAHALGRIGDAAGIIPLRPLLNDDEPTVRLATAESLGKLGDVASAPALARLLCDPDPVVAKGVHEPLAALGTNAVPALIAAVHTEHKQSRIAVLSLLGRAGDPRAVPALLTAAGDSDTSVAGRARRSLEDIVEAGHGIPELTASLKNSDPAVRTTAILYLKMRPDNVPFDALAAALKDDEPVVRERAAEILELRANEKEIGAAVPLLNDRDFDVRTAAATALASIGDARGNDVLLGSLRKIIPGLAPLRDSRDYHPDIGRAAAAMDGLANTGDKRVVPLLLPLVAYRNRRIACPSIEVLGRIGDKRAVDSLLALLHENKQNHRDHDSPMKLACTALGRIGDPRAFGPLAELLRKSTHRWWTPIRVKVVDAMLMIDKQRSVEPLIAALNKAEMCDGHAIDHTCKALADIGDPRAITPMTRFLLSDITTIRAGTARALKELAETNRECTRELVAQLKQPNARIRSIIGLVIARIGEPALPDLLKTLTDKDPQLRHGAAWTLGSMKNEKAVAPLIKVLADDSEHVRAAAAWALGSIGAPAAVDPVIKLTSDKSPRARMGAVTALGDICDKRAMATLTRVARADNEKAVREAAAAALQKIATGKADTPDTTPDTPSPATARRPAPAGRPAGQRRAVPVRPGTPPPVKLAKLSRELVGTNAALRAVAAAELAVLGRSALPGIEEALPGSRSVDARLDAVTVLAQIGGPEILPGLVNSLENVPETDTAKRDRLITTVANIMTGLGNHYIEEFNAAVIDADCGTTAKEAAARACIRIGRPSVGYISGRILKWNVFPNPAELKLWVRTLGKIGEPGARLALEHAASQKVQGITELVATARRRIGERTTGPQPPPLPPRLPRR